MEDHFKYHSGFGNSHESEALPGTLPQGRNQPQRAAHGLYSEQLSGSAFTAPRNENLRSWLYRIRPAVIHGSFSKIENGLLRSAFDEVPPTPNQLRWDPIALPSEPTDFVQGLVTLMGNGELEANRGTAVHIYLINKPMTDRFFYNADGDFLFVPQQGAVVVKTELGPLHVKPGEIAVVPRGVKFQVNPVDKTARGYLCENYGRHFELPYLGPIGANGLANPRDFLSASAAYEERMGNFKLVGKFQGNLWQADITHSPFDVVGWHGNYYPYKYDLAKFQTIGTVSFDHPDPSIFTVLTSPGDRPGTANLDFVIFPPRWMVAEDTFRPPYYHRNCMSEYMGLIHGVYDAKVGGGFEPGGGSLHNVMSAHGPDAETFLKASAAELKPQYLDNTLAFMFESSMAFRPTKYAMEAKSLQKDYLACWKDLKSHFNPKGVS